MALRVATWNVNSVRQRLDHLARFTEMVKPQLVCLQETKVRNEEFPLEAVRAMGYRHVVIHGGKAYNGVAILSKKPFESEERLVWCGKDDHRHISVTPKNGPEIHNFYVPSGGPTPDPENNDKFAHKLEFLKQMASWLKKDKVKERPAILLGDFNVAPLEQDVWNHKRLRRSVGHTDEECALMAKLWKAGDLIDVPRHFDPAPAPLYSWWGYRFPGSVEKNYGWRLDHVLVTPPLAGALKRVRTIKETRLWEKPSDHVPVVLDLA